MTLERPATARAVEDRNQEFKSDRADVREMEGSLERLRGDIAEVVRKLVRRTCGRASSAVAGGADQIVADPIVGGADNGEGTGPSKGHPRRSYSLRWLRLCRKSSSPPSSNFKGTAYLCYAAMRELHREIKKDQ